MATEPAIEIRDLSKRYRIGARQASGDNLGDQLRGMLANLGRRGRQEHVWALKDVTLTIDKGEVWGVIGSNGAGKSTLLKLISRITRPTSGTLVTRGRVSALLEVGTGFHPELTGRENVYLNGSILGMKRREIVRKFDEIVEFAGVDKFIDTPVKRYSSGMQLRLAFAVAAHLEPEILVIDEVLAVGDVEFQKKCLQSVERMKGGRTVLFVSHNLGAIRALCQKAVWLGKGGVVEMGDVDTVVQSYLRATTQRGAGASFRENRLGGNGAVQFTSAQLLDADDVERDTFMVGDFMKIRVGFHAPEVVHNPIFGIGVLRSSDGLQVCVFHTQIAGVPIKEVEGEGQIEVTIPQFMLLPDQYQIYLWCGGSSVYDHVSQAAAFAVIPGPVFNSQVPHRPSHGVFHVPSSWSIMTKVDR